MKEILIKKYVMYIFSIAILIFVLNKLYIRNWILENDLPDFLLIVTYSIPNLIEAIIVTLLLTGILLQVRQHYNKKLGSIKVEHINILASSIAAVYVISQELKFHNLGGNNVYDPYDLLASFIGLIGTFGIIQLFGFMNENEVDTKE
ncbi:hypothetical protein [Psychroflexus aestuariivivens]|uniref:hypothetical protein n=1 Tax=Psychroflexus aestuariivivens TaxID=1795040 RepID=UPI000FD98592|nr:hypothetical protein [Psychroflexus aestuariivivens]